jgi:hypothetical protein
MRPPTSAAAGAFSPSPGSVVYPAGSVEPLDREHRLTLGAGAAEREDGRSVGDDRVGGPSVQERGRRLPGGLDRIGSSAAGEDGAERRRQHEPHAVTRSGAP